MKRIYILFIFFTTTLMGQSIEGNFSKLIDKKIKLEGFNGLKSYLISETSTDGNGNLNWISSGISIGGSGSLYVFTIMS